jgi:hypothetical protein
VAPWARFVSRRSKALVQDDVERSADSAPGGAGLRSTRIATLVVDLTGYPLDVLR